MYKIVIDADGLIAGGRGIGAAVGDLRGVDPEAALGGSGTGKLELYEDALSWRRFWREDQPGGCGPDPRGPDAGEVTASEG